MTSSASELVLYVSRVREFDGRDWLTYVAWVGLLVGLLGATAGFLGYGAWRGVAFPPEAWLVPAGAFVFTIAAAVDTIGHRTVYRDAIAGPEGLVHVITIVCGVGSVVFLCAAHSRPGAFAIPAAVLTVLSFAYSFVDEAFHWRRYLHRRSDVVEMWSHVGILVGHGTMMAAWWSWFLGGYEGAAATAGLFFG